MSEDTKRELREAADQIEQQIQANDELEHSAMNDLERVVWILRDLGKKDE